ncbi:MAG: N-acetylglucosamine-6-phosphate deacetylase [Clostridia bacterium]
MKMAVTHARVITPQRIIENGTVVFDEKILAVLEEGAFRPSTFVGTILDAQGLYLSPGFIDLHTHGGGGREVMEATAEATKIIAKTHARHGTTSILLTTLAAEVEDLSRVLKNAKPFVGIVTEGARILGVHLEGPFLSKEFCGAQNASVIGAPKGREAEVAQLLVWHDVIKLMSIAPELEGALALSDELHALGIVTSVGHSAADFDDMVAAVAHGFTHVTHLYSACSMVKRVNAYRVLGVVESSFLLDDLTVEVIADGRHLPFKLLELIVKIKGAENVVLVSDSLGFAGTHMEEGHRYVQSNGIEVIYEDAVMKMVDRQAFAGSVTLGDGLVRNMVQQVGIPILQAVQMMTRNPAKVLGMEHRIGSIIKGQMADLVLFDEDINIMKTYVEGAEQG